MGFWNRAELLPVWLHLAAALGGLGFVAGLATGDERPRAALGHPLVLVTAALAAWSSLCAPLVDLSRLSLAGTLQSGFGALWFWDLAILSACALTTRAHPAVWTKLCWWAVALTVAVAVLKAYDNGHSDHLLIYISAHYSWIGLALIVTVAPYGRLRGHWLICLATLAGAAAIIAASQSWTAAALGVAALGLVLLGWVGHRRPGLARLTNSNRIAVALVATVALLPYLALCWLPALGEVESLRDRQLLMKMMHAALSEQSGFGWLIGHGWGRTQDAFHAYLNVTGEVLWKPTWIFLESDYFSAHSWVLESLYAAGLPGLLLTFAGFVAIPLVAPPERRFFATALAIMLAGMSALWFSLALAIPFVAVAMAAVTRPEMRGTVPRRIAIPLLVILAAAQIGFAAAQFSFARDIDRFRAGDLASFPMDPRGSDLTASEVIRELINALAEAKVAKPEALPRVRAIMAYLDARVPVSTSSHFVVTAVSVLNSIYGTGELAWMIPGIPDGKATWRTALNRLLTIAPGRTDVVIPYLSRHAMIGNLAEVSRITRAILARDGNDAVGLYFQGLLLVLDSSPDNKRRGIVSLRASVPAGIERFMPLDPTVARLIGR